MELIKRLTAAALAMLIPACAANSELTRRPSPREAFLLKNLPAPAPTPDDEAWARSSREFLARSAGRGLEDSVDISAACGCVEGGDSGGGGSGGGPVSPDIDGPHKTAVIRVKIVLPNIDQED